MRLEALPGVREVISSRLSRLGSDAIELLAAAAVLGHDFDFDTLRRVADLSETEALSAMDEALANHLLVGTKHEKGYSGKTVYGFSHDKIRCAVYAEACEARREVLHRRALEVLEAEAAHPAELAYHALATGLQEPAFQHSLAAGDEAMAVFAVRDAIGYYERARRLLVAGEKRWRMKRSRASEIEHLYVRVSEHGMSRFFRRLAEGVFDEEDLKLRTRELASFVEEASGRYGLDPGEVFAVGFSNGANIAASLLLSNPGLLRGAVLFRPMVPFEPEEPPDLSGVPIFVGAGEMDQIVPRENTERLVELLKEAGAEVSLRWQPGGHGLEMDEVQEARGWLGRVLEGQEGAA